MQPVEVALAALAEHHALAADHKGRGVSLNRCLRCAATSVAPLPAAWLACGSSPRPVGAIPQQDEQVLRAPVHFTRSRRRLVSRGLQRFAPRACGYKPSYPTALMANGFFAVLQTCLQPGRACEALCSPSPQRPAGPQAVIWAHASRPRSLFGTDLGGTHRRATARHGKPSYRVGVGRQILLIGG